MEKKLILADGTEIANANVLEAGGNAICFYIRNGMTIAEAFGLMVDPEKTRTIRAVQGGEETAYTGYTDLRSIQKDERQISGSLRKA